MDDFGKSLKNFSSQLEKAQSELSKMDGTHSYNLNEIFSPSFMTSHTHYNSFDSFLRDCGITNQSEFDAYPDNQFDKKVKENTAFSSYEDMLNTAFKDYLSKRTGLDFN